MMAVEALTREHAVAATLLFGTLAPWLLIRFGSRRWAWVSLAVAANLALAGLAVRVLPVERTVVHGLALFSGAATLLWSVVGALLAVGDHRSTKPLSGRVPDHRRCARDSAETCAVMAMAATGVFVVYELIVRAVYFGLELRRGAPFPDETMIPFGVWGLGVSVASATACLLVFGVTRKRWLLTAAFWWFVIVALGWGLLEPAYRMTASGGWTRTGVALSISLGWTACLGIGCWLQARGLQERRRRTIWDPPGPSEVPSSAWPGFSASVGTVGLLQALVTCFQLVAPTEDPWGYRGNAAASAVGGAVSAAAVFWTVGRRWSANRADIGMGLATLSVVSAVVMAVPSGAVVLGERFPMVFNAMMAGFGIMTGYWIWISKVWRQQIGADGAWTATGFMAPRCERFAFFAAAMALVCGSLMALWPRFRPAPHPDDSLGRFAAAVTVHLILLLVLLYGGRVTGRASFGAMVLLVLASLIAFIFIRSQPFASSLAWARDLDFAAGGAC